MKIARALTHLGHVSARPSAPCTQGRVEVGGVLGLRRELGWAEGGLGALGAPPDSERRRSFPVLGRFVCLPVSPFHAFPFLGRLSILGNLSWGAVVLAVFSDSDLLFLARACSDSFLVPLLVCLLRSALPGRTFRSCSFGTF